MPPTLQDARAPTRRSSLKENRDPERHVTTVVPGMRPTAGLAPSLCQPLAPWDLPCERHCV